MTEAEAQRCPWNPEQQIRLANFFIRKAGSFKAQCLARWAFVLNWPSWYVFPLSSDLARCKRTAMSHRASCILVPPCLLHKSSASDSHSFHAKSFSISQKVRHARAVLLTHRMLNTGNSNSAIHLLSLSSNQQMPYGGHLSKSCVGFPMMKSFKWVLSE